MKKLFSVLMVILATASHSFSQEFKIGIKGGPSITNISDDSNNKIKLGIHAGVFLDLMFSEKMGGGAEILYSQKGTIHRGNPNIKVAIDYIDIPLLFLYRFTPNLLGQAGFTLSSPIRGVRIYDDGRPSEGFLDHINKQVLSFPIGVRYDIGQLNLGIRADLGLSSIGNDGKKNNVLMISIGYAFTK